MFRARVCGVEEGWMVRLAVRFALVVGLELIILVPLLAVIGRL